MTVEFRKGRYGVRWAADGGDLAACQALRHRAFFGLEGCDRDAFDPLCEHLMIAGDQGLVATCRVHIFAAGSDPSASYTSQSYDLSRFSTLGAPLMEVGRFCMDVQDADVLRLAWGALAQVVDAAGVGLIFGCTSFAGVSPVPYAAGFSLLARRYRAPSALRPGVVAAEAVPLDTGVSHVGGAAQLPPLLRSYLGMGGWVSDHAVVDREMNTLHVLTGVEVAAIPVARARALRAVAG